MQNIFGAVYFKKPKTYFGLTVCICLAVSPQSTYIFLLVIKALYFLGYQLNLILPPNMCPI